MRFPYEASCLWVVMPSFLAAVFSGASAFNATVSAWDVRVVGVMKDMFTSSGMDLAQSLCGFYWMQSSTAQMAFDTLPQIGINKDGAICHCPSGTYYQKARTTNPNPNTNSSPNP